jgi:hypothetical protein
MLALPADGVDPLTVVLSWLGQHGLPAVEQLSQLVTLAEHVAEVKARQAYTVAFAQLQQALAPITPTQTSTFGAYASLGDMVESVRKPLAAHGFALSFALNDQREEQTGELMLILTTTLSHVAGHRERCMVAVPIEVGPVSNRTGQPVRSIAQARAAAITAARRQAILTMLNLSTGDPEQPDAQVEAEPAVPDGVEEAMATLRSVTDRPKLAEAWGQLPYVMRRHLQAAQPALMEELKARFPAPVAPEPTAEQPAE